MVYIRMMKRLSLALALLLPLLFAAGPRKTIYLDKMGGFEDYIRRALEEKEVNVEVLTEEEHPDLKAIIGKRFKSVYAEALFKKQTGRSEDTEITLIDVKTGKKILVYPFRMGSDDSSKRSAASGFVNELRKKIE
jgi:hypothetical protein